ncbi:DUF930 domain-containing protein [Rhizobium sp. BK602]|uniref:DUF930 domain-containing protein n=1 Tax=Rhizobium sp. BK602 TaxID=2586986 RepID=UPI0016110A9D|nr:DUF930 domain-containing protein [Rhizobium sp. BK602]MBB3607311.1 hypothetical protein [Rhizobium sp. BK602]
MEKVAEKRDKEMRPGFVLSILLHVLFFAIFLLPLLPAPPQAKPEQSVNVELVPQQEEKQELATKENEKPDQPPKPTPKPDEKPQQQTAEAQQQPEQPQGKKSDEQPPKQSDPDGKEQAEKPSSKPAETKADKPEEHAEKPASKPDDAGADKLDDKATQQLSATETPLPDMKGDEKDPTTTQQAEALSQANDTPQTPPNDAAAEAAEVQAQAQQAQQQADAQSQEANAAKPPATDSTAKTSSSAPDVLATNEPSDSQVQQPQAQSADQNDLQAQAAVQAPPSDPQEQNPANRTKDEAKVEPQIVVPLVKPSPTEQASQSQSASSSQGGQTGGTALVTEPQPPKSLVPKRAIEAKKLYSGAEMARLSKSDYDAWKKLPRRDRVRYLCNSEEKLQFSHDLGAVGFNNSALSSAMLSDISLFGDGVAVDTPSGWQRVAFTCQVDSDALKVVAFSYTVRGHVAPSQMDRSRFLGN